jgi:hypothetical protein
VIETGPHVSHFPDSVSFFGILTTIADPICLRCSQLVLTLIADTSLPHFGQMKIPMLMMDLQKRRSHCDNDIAHFSSNTLKKPPAAHSRSKRDPRR